MQMLKCLQYRHDCQHLGCSNPTCDHCRLCQKRRCSGSFKKKYLAPSDVLEAECGAQVYVVVVDTSTGHLVQYGLEDTFLELSLVDGRKLDLEEERPEALDACQLLTNKSGQALLVHGRSGAYTDDMRIVVPMISGQAMLPDLKVTDSSEALLTGRAPPFRLLARVVQRGGIPLPGIAPVLSEPFVVATARVRAASKLDIPHVDDNVSKIEGLGVQTQKKLEDIGGAAEAVGIPRSNLQVPRNCVTKVGEFRELVELAESSNSLKDTLKNVLRCTKMWDVARDHVRKAVSTDVQLRVYHPDGRDDVGLVYKCTSFNVIDINRPVGLLRKRQGQGNQRDQGDQGIQGDQQLIDVIWLSADIQTWPDAVRRIVPRAASCWWTDGHPGWQFLPLTTHHLPSIAENGDPKPSMSSFSFKQQQTLQDRHQLNLPGPVFPASGTGFPQLSRTVYSGGGNSGGNTGGNTGGNSGGSPFEDPSYIQNLMDIVGTPSDPMAHLPRSGEPNDGDNKRKADASLETWMALNKSLDGIDLDLPSTLAGVENLIMRERGVDSSLLANLGSLGLLGGNRSAPNSILPDSAPVTLPGLTMGDLRREFSAFFSAEEQRESRDRLQNFLEQNGLLPATR
jgi:hypothetical protein